MTDAFPPDYFTARARFRAAAARLGWPAEAHAIATSGPSGEPLTIDVTYPPDCAAEAALVVSGGLHGVEGPFGSAVQCNLLESERVLQAQPRGVRLVLIHALNPFGFCYGRRANEDNVDLNRNFLLPGEPYAGSPPTYAKLDWLLNPKRPPPALDLFPVYAMIGILRYGRAVLTQAIAEGQYDFPLGLFYGGAAPSATVKILMANLRRWLSGVRRVLHLDLHTGLGQWATHKLLADYPVPPERLTALKRHFGAAAFADGSAANPAYTTRGSIGRWCVNYFPDVDYTYFCAEFGTFPPLLVLAALRAENQAHFWGKPGTSRYRRAKRRLQELLCPSSPRWRRTALWDATRLVEIGTAALAAGA